MNAIELYFCVFVSLFLALLTAVALHYLIGKEKPPKVSAEEYENRAQPQKMCDMCRSAPAIIAVVGQCQDCGAIYHFMDVCVVCAKEDAALEQKYAGEPWME